MTSVEYYLFAFRVIEEVSLICIFFPSVLKFLLCLDFVVLFTFSRFRRRLCRKNLFFCFQIMFYELNMFWKGNYHYFQYRISNVRFSALMRCPKVRGEDFSFVNPDILFI